MTAKGWPSTCKAGPSVVRGVRSSADGVEGGKSEVGLRGWTGASPFNGRRDGDVFVGWFYAFEVVST